MVLCTQARSQWVDNYMFVWVSVAFFQDIPVVVYFHYCMFSYVQHDMIDYYLILIWWFSHRYEIGFDCIRILILFRSFLESCLTYWGRYTDINDLTTTRYRSLELPESEARQTRGQERANPLSKAWVRHSSQWVTAHLDYVACHSNHRLSMIRFIYYVVY